MIVLDERAIARALTRIAHEILEKNTGSRDLVLLGIPTRGNALAQRLGAKIASIEGEEVLTGSVDATLYRDDIGLTGDNPPLKEMDIQFSIDGKIVVLVDDVLFTGRTIRAAMNALMDFGRPAAIQLAVLIDRGHRELPIRPDYVGKNLPTAPNEGVRVRLEEMDGVTSVILIDKTSEKK